MRMLPALAALLLFIFCAAAADWPQWKGPNRDGTSSEKDLLKKWPAAGPKLLHTYRDLGTGYSTPAIVGDMLYITGANAKKVAEVIAIDLKTNKEVWRKTLGPDYDFKGNAWGVGPRATTSVAGGKVFSLTGAGLMVCSDAKSGDEVWKVDLYKDLQGLVSSAGDGPEKLGWGYCWSPLVDGDKVICVPGGSEGMVAALDVKTGKTIWRSKDLPRDATYASPVKATIDGVEQYVVLSQVGIAGVSADKGELLWEHEKGRPFRDVVIPTPLVKGNHVYISVGYGEGCDLIEVKKGGNKFTTKEVYSNKLLKSRTGGLVMVAGHIYGASEQRGWVCQDFKTGKLKWFTRRASDQGSMTYAEGYLYGYDTVNGDVMLIEANPEKFVKVSSFPLPEKTKLRAPSGRHWTPPVIADGKLYIRDQDLLFCFDIKGK